MLCVCECVSVLKEQHAHSNLRPRVHSYQAVHYLKRYTIQIDQYANNSKKENESDDTVRENCIRCWGSIKFQIKHTLSKSVDIGWLQQRGGKFEVLIFCLCSHACERTCTCLKSKRLKKKTNPYHKRSGRCGVKYDLLSGNTRNNNSKRVWWEGAIIQDLNNSWLNIKANRWRYLRCKLHPVNLAQLECLGLWANKKSELIITNSF